MKTCPRCHHELLLGQKQTISLLACPQCGGVWLEQPLAQKLMKCLQLNKPPKFATDAQCIADYFQKESSAQVNSSAPLHCITCGELAHRLCLGPGLVEVDLCTTHGLWFDRGELQKILWPYLSTDTHPQVHREDAMQPFPTTLSAPIEENGSTGTNVASTILTEVAGESAEWVADTIIEYIVEMLTSLAD